MSANSRKPKPSAAVELPECPVCLDTMTAPIFQCQSGHSLCNSCTSSLTPPICPICRMAMTQMRNWQLEEIVNKARVPCTYNSLGCKMVFPSTDMDDHLKECIFRDMDCPYGIVFGTCSWRGKLKELMGHFKDRHANNCNVNLDTDVVLNDISVTKDDRRLYLVQNEGKLFIVTVKIDTLLKSAYWTVQLIGAKRPAQQYIYEIHVNSNQDSRRKILYIEHCFNDTIRADDVFRQGKCAIVPLEVLTHFIKDSKLNCQFSIKKVGPPHFQKGKPDKSGDGQKTGGKHENYQQGQRGQGYGQKGQGQGQKGQGQGQKGQGKDPRQHYKGKNNQNNN